MYRTADMEDCSKIYDLICELEGKQLPFQKFAEIYQKQLNSKSYECIVCEYDDNIIGVLNLRFEEQLHHANYIAEIMEFVVSTSYRNRGIGKEMFAVACQRAETFGCSQIEVACNQLRKDTHRFYEREGMHNFHFKFSKSFLDEDATINAIGR